jgi:hypothetical protein
MFNWDSYFDARDADDVEDEEFELDEEEDNS